MISLTDRHSGQSPVFIRSRDFSSALCRDLRTNIEAFGHLIGIDSTTRHILAVSRRLFDAPWRNYRTNDSLPQTIGMG